MLLQYFFGPPLILLKLTLFMLLIGTSFTLTLKLLLFERIEIENKQNI